MAAWTTASTTGPPRDRSVSEIADVGPIRSTPTLAITDNARGTSIIPMPKAPTARGTTRFGKYGTPRLSVEPYNMATSTTMLPAITTIRGGNHDTSRDDMPAPALTATANGMNANPARSAL